jgi:succinate-semialdehyde dehydrogenase/glutarate-semialdehyde dehydrogenase
VAESIYELFVDKLILKLKQKIVGNPREKVDLGPMVSKKARSEVHNQVENTKNKGAKLMLGGEIPKGKGSFYPITVLTEVKPGMETFDEEVFGPVFSITKAKNEMESVRLANKSSYGLGASIFTENIKKARRICDNELNVGICYINDFVKSDPELPFGGIKESGFGRELSLNGFLEFVNVKTIVVNKI